LDGNQKLLRKSETVKRILFTELQHRY